MRLHRSCDQVQPQWFYGWLLEPILAGLSVYPATNSNAPRSNYNTTGDWTDDRGSDSSPAGGDAACANHAASADDGACFHGAQGDEASCQQ
jgi:hypothetical protein